MTHPQPATSLPTRVTRTQIAEALAILGIDPNTITSITITPIDVSVTTVIPAVSDPGTGAGWPHAHSTDHIPVTGP